MRNKYPGTCYRCGQRVEAGAGHFELAHNPKRWLCQHAECAIAYRGRPKQVALLPRPGRDQGAATSAIKLLRAIRGEPE